MTMPQALLFGLLAIALAIVFAASGRQLEAQATGPFAIAAGNDGTAYKIDTTSGQVWYCRGATSQGGDCRSVPTK